MGIGLKLNFDKMSRLRSLENIRLGYDIAAMDNDIDIEDMILQEQCRQEQLVRGPYRPLTVIKEEITSDHEAQSGIGEEGMVQVRKADWAPKLTCMFKKNGCDKEYDDEEVIANHEIECGYRKVPCFRGCPDQLAMSFKAHIFSAHDDVYGIHRRNPGKWLLTTRCNATKMWFGAGTDLWFWASLHHDDENKQWRCATTVFGGKNVAKKFRAEMRLSSLDGDTSLIFNGNVYCLDDRYQQDTSKEFCINHGQFRIYNEGRIQL